jgi:hypothetical protein
MRMALYIAANAPELKLVATASTVAELITCSKSFQPDAVIVADDLGPAGDLGTPIETLREAVPHGRILVAGPSAAALARATGTAPLTESLDLLDTLLAPAARGHGREASMV